MVSHESGEQRLNSAAAACVREGEGTGVKDAKDKGVGEAVRGKGIKGVGIGVRETTCGNGEAFEVFVRNGLEGTSEMEVIGWQASITIKKSQGRTR
jgi:hypothetical protein